MTSTTLTGSWRLFMILLCTNFERYSQYAADVPLYASTVYDIALY